MWSLDEERENAYWNESMTREQHMNEACKEYAREFGKLNPKEAWISTPYDTWEPNVFYVGPEVPHPEMEECDYPEFDMDGTRFVPF